MRYEDRFPIVEVYLRASFPGATVCKLHRAGDPHIENVQAHDWTAEMWRVKAPERDYDLAITDEALEQLPPKRLVHTLRYNAIRAALVECPEDERVWLLTSGARTRAKRGESPVD